MFTTCYCLCDRDGNNLRAGAQYEEEKLLDMCHHHIWISYYNNQQKIDDFCKHTDTSHMSAFVPSSDTLIVEFG